MNTKRNDIIDPAEYVKELQKDGGKLFLFTALLKNVDNTRSMQTTSINEKRRFHLIDMFS